MTNREAIIILKNLKKCYSIDYFDIEDNAALDMAILALDGIDLNTKNKIKEVWKVIREFEEKYMTYSFLNFNNYMEEFNDHTINDIQDYMWDMYKLFEDIKYRLPEVKE